MSVNSIWKIAAIVTNVHKLYTEKYCYRLYTIQKYRKVLSDQCPYTIIF